MIQPSREPGTSLQLRRLFAAPRERVFRAWIERDALQRWFRPHGMPIVVSRLEPHVGGGFQFETQGADGTCTTTSGTFLEISFPDKLVFTWVSNAIPDRDTLVTVEFITQGSSTEVVLTHERFPAGTRIAIFQQGWSSMLDQLADIV